MKSPEELLFERLSDAEKLLPTAPTEGSPVEKEIFETDRSTETPVTIRTLFTHHDSHPIVLDYALIRAFGLEWLSWSTPTIWSEIQKTFKSEISEHNRNKIQIVKTLHLSSVPWDSWNVFEKVIQGLNNNIPRWDIMQAASIEQLYAGIDIMDNIRVEEFSDEVRRYMAASVLNEDIIFVPSPLDFIQLEVSQPYYICLDCENQESAIDHDGICSSCSGKFRPEKGLSFRPDLRVFEEGYGRNIELKLRFDPDKVEDRWLQVRELPLKSVDLQETQEDSQIAKLLVARDYMNIRRKQLAEQLTSLKSWLVAS